MPFVSEGGVVGGQNNVDEVRRRLQLRKKISCSTTGILFFPEFFSEEEVDAFWW